MATQPESLPGNSLSPPTPILQFGAQYQNNNGSSTLPPNSPSSSNSTGSPTGFGFGNTDQKPLIPSTPGALSSPNGLLTASVASGMPSYGPTSTGLSQSSMDKLANSYGQSVGSWPTPGTPGVPEGYQQMWYHQYYSQGGDPYGLNNPQVNSKKTAQGKYVRMAGNNGNVRWGQCNIKRKRLRKLLS